MISTEDSHSGRVRASRTRVDESLEGSNHSSSALEKLRFSLPWAESRISVFAYLRGPLPDTDGTS